MILNKNNKMGSMVDSHFVFMCQWCRSHSCIICAEFASITLYRTECLKGTNWRINFMKPNTFRQNNNRFNHFLGYFLSEIVFIDTFKTWISTIFQKLFQSIGYIDGDSFRRKHYCYNNRYWHSFHVIGLAS